LITAHVLKQHTREVWFGKYREMLLPRKCTQQCESVHNNDESVHNNDESVHNNAILGVCQLA
jgi:hypothetical protein